MKIKDFNALSVRSLQCVGGETSQLYACVCGSMLGFRIFHLLWSCWIVDIVGSLYFQQFGSGTRRLCSIDSIAIAELEPDLNGLYKIFLLRPATCSVVFKF